MWLTQELIDVLACPHCKGALEFREVSRESRLGGAAASDGGAMLICHACDRVFPIVREVPDFMPDRDTAESS